MIVFFLGLGLLSGAPVGRRSDALADSLAFERFVTRTYDACGRVSPSIFAAFRLGLIGYCNMKREGLLPNDSVIAIIDYQSPSTENRLFVVNLSSESLLYETLVAHGKHSGENNARSFSNDPRSLMSSLGFYVTAGTYFGRHGYSLALRGVDQGYNDNAVRRSIVVHGADYVSLDFIRKHGRIGRSWGCPAVPIGVCKGVIDAIKGGCCLFAYYGDEDYLEKSQFLRLTSAIEEYRDISPNKERGRNSK